MAPKALIRTVCAITLFSGLSAAQKDNFAIRQSHATAHAKHSHVLVFRKLSIQRGPNFSVRAEALRYQKGRHLKDLVWYSTAEECFTTSDSKVMASLKETEVPQEELAKKEMRGGGSDLNLAHQLSREQTRHSWQRDEIVWSLFDKLREQARLSPVECGGSNY